MNKLRHRPQALQERIFQRLFDVAEIAKFNSKERQAYEDSLKYYRDLKNAFDTIYEEAYEQGTEKGIEKGITEGIEKGKSQEKIEMARNGLKMGLPVSTIAQMTGLSEEEINKLK